MINHHPDLTRYTTLKPASKMPYRTVSSQSMLDDEGIIKDLAGKHWTQINPEIVYDHYENLPLLNYADFAVLLPAWISAIVVFNGDYRSYTIAERISFQLSPTYNAGEIAELRTVFEKQYGSLFESISRDILWCLRLGEEADDNSQEEVLAWTDLPPF